MAVQLLPAEAACTVQLPVFVGPVITVLQVVAVQLLPADAGAAVQLPVFVGPVVTVLQVLAPAVHTVPSAVLVVFATVVHELTPVGPPEAIYWQAFWSPVQVVPFDVPVLTFIVHAPLVHAVQLAVSY